MKNGINDKTKNDMKKSDTVLLAFTAAVNTSMSIPIPEETIEVTETPELTNEQIDALADGPLPELSRYGYELLEAIKADEPHFQAIKSENRIAERDEQDVTAERGLTTEINRSTSLVSVTDTLDGVTALLRRHPYGFKNGSRNSKGQVGTEPYTESENQAAEAWLASIDRKG